jgi:hypothetical protein
VATPGVPLPQASTVVVTDSSNRDRLPIAHHFGRHRAILRQHRQCRRLPYCASLGIGSAGADGIDGAGEEKFTREVILIIRFPSRPSRLNAISMPTVRTNACDLRDRPARACRIFWPIREPPGGVVSPNEYLWACARHVRPPGRRGSDSRLSREGSGRGEHHRSSQMGGDPSIDQCPACSASRAPARGFRLRQNDGARVDGSGRIEEANWWFTREPSKMALIRRLEGVYM